MIVGRNRRVESRKISLGDADLGIVEGRVPPHDLDAEAAVLSAVLLGGRSALADCSDVITWKSFYSESHGRIFESIVKLDAEDKPIDVVTVASHLKDEKRLAQVGGMPYLGQILDAAPVIANVRAYASKVADLAQLRQAIIVCAQYMARGYEEGAAAKRFIAELEGEVYRLSQGATETRDRSIDLKPLLVRVFADISKSYSDGRPPGIATGFKSYDDLTVGLHRKELTLVAARPGMGKTALLLAWARNVAGSDPMILADDGAPWRPQGCGFFTLEMPDDQIGKRLIAIDSGVSAHRIRTGRLADTDWTPMTMSCHKLAGYPFEIDDTPALSIGDARSKVRRMRAKMERAGSRLTVVFFDYLQLMKGETAERRETEIGEISRGLKQLAKDEDVAVVAGCQLNRALESRPGAEKRPRVSDLRESGNLEQDADNVVFIYRGSVYGEKDPEGEEGRAELIVGKQRNGPVGTAVVRYVAGSTRFEEMPGY